MWTKSIPCDGTDPYEVEIRSAFKSSKLAERYKYRVLAKADERALQAEQNICVFDNF